MNKYKKTTQQIFFIVLLLGHSSLFAGPYFWGLSTLPDFVGKRLYNKAFSARSYYAFKDYRKDLKWLDWNKDFIEDLRGDLSNKLQQKNYTNFDGAIDQYFQELKNDEKKRSDLLWKKGWWGIKFFNTYRSREEVLNLMAQAVEKYIDVKCPPEAEVPNPPTVPPQLLSIRNSLHNKKPQTIKISEEKRESQQLADEMMVFVDDLIAKIKSGEITDNGIVVQAALPKDEKKIEIINNLNRDIRKEIIARKIRRYAKDKNQAKIEDSDRNAFLLLRKFDSAKNQKISKIPREVLQKVLSEELSNIASDLSESKESENEKRTQLSTFEQDIQHKLLKRRVQLMRSAYGDNQLYQKFDGRKTPIEIKEEDDVNFNTAFHDLFYPWNNYLKTGSPLSSLLQQAITDFRKVLKNYFNPYFPQNVNYMLRDLDLIFSDEQIAANILNNFDLSQLLPKLNAIKNEKERKEMLEEFFFQKISLNKDDIITSLTNKHISSTIKDPKKYEILTTYANRGKEIEFPISQGVNSDGTKDLQSVFGEGVCFAGTLRLIAKEIDGEKIEKSDVEVKDTDRRIQAQGKVATYYPSEEYEIKGQKYKYNPVPYSDFKLSHPVSKKTFLEQMTRYINANKKELEKKNGSSLLVSLRFNDGGGHATYVTFDEPRGVYALYDINLGRTFSYSKLDHPTNISPLEATLEAYYDMVLAHYQRTHGEVNVGLGKVAKIEKNQTK